MKRTYTLNRQADVVHDDTHRDERCNVDDIQPGEKLDLSSAGELQMAIEDGSHLCAWCFGEDEEPA